MIEDFYKYQAQTTPHPLGLEVSHAQGTYIFSTDGQKHLDFVAGVSACSLGHCHPRVTKAIHKQVDKYMHTMVYGEYAQQPAVDFCKELSAYLPKELNQTYLVNSGTEAIEGAMKLAKRATGRSQIIAGANAYHGNTHGSMSVSGNEKNKRAFRPLLPDVSFIEFNSEKDLQKITHQTAAVLLETIQGSAGFVLPINNYLKKVRKRCDETGTFLILDEIQPGFGRTGKLFGFQNFDVIPDIVVMGKGMGGGLPVGAFTANEHKMNLLSDNPKLGHITTFGGNPVIAAASLATLREITQTDLMPQTLIKEQVFRKKLKHPLIKSVHGMGLMLALITPSAEIANQVVLRCKAKGLILFWLMFEPTAVRITPPLTISKDEIIEGCQMILDVCDELLKEKN